MKLIRQLIIPLLAASVFFFASAPLVSAQVLPKVGTEADACSEFINPADKKSRLRPGENALRDENSFRAYLIRNSNNLSAARDKALGCAIKFGHVRLFMLPFMITYLVQFLLSIAGIIAVFFMVLGGYHYVVGGITEEKEKGKKTILYALMGLVIALSAWMLVNFLQVALTS